MSTYALPLTRRQERALDKIERCPSCGAWAYWRTISHYLEAELDPEYCHHGHDTHESRNAA